MTFAAAPTTTTEPRAARKPALRIAKAEPVLIGCDEYDHYEIASDSRPGLMHEVITSDDKPISCTCEGWQGRARSGIDACRHMNAVAADLSLSDEERAFRTDCRRYGIDFTAPSAHWDCAVATLAELRRVQAQCEAARAARKARGAE